MRPSAHNKKFIAMENRSLKTKFLDLVQEMIVLLPDVNKQRELFEAHADSVRQLLADSDQDVTVSSANSAWADKAVRPSGAKPTSTLVTKLVSCAHCGQYFLNTEVNFHNSTHHAKQIGSMQVATHRNRPGQILEDFPSLSATVPAPRQQSSFNSSASSSLPASAILNKPKQQENAIKTETRKAAKPPRDTDDFPALSSTVAVSAENRFSAMPSATIFNMPSSHLSILNKKKHRLQK